MTATTTERPINKFVRFQKLFMVNRKCEGSSQNSGLMATGTYDKG